MDMDLSDNQMIFRPLSAEQIAINEKKMNMTLDDIIKISRKTIGCDPRKPRPYLNRRKNVGGNFSNVLCLRESKPSTKHNTRQKFPTAVSLKVSKPSVRQGLPTKRYVNLQDNQYIVRAIATNVQPTTTRTRPLIRNKMPNLSNSRKEDIGHTAYEKVNLGLEFMINWLGTALATSILIQLFFVMLAGCRAGITPVQKRRFAEKKKEMKWQKQGYSAQKFGFCAYANARKKVVPHSTDYYEY
ncbi:hypothetical protein MKW98_005155 [Papaver atlanticum]|uniref:Uncharacterized protein n=1 Tax=Papaver atlanticum TaxID=357466 RepID=A0AAD4RW82_9MAGN|nr:hypothetical protein MKW98_005155 [Papaver atlanticum]